MEYPTLWVRFFWLVILSLSLAGCQPAVNKDNHDTILDGDQAIPVATDMESISGALAETDISLSPHDRILINGVPAQAEQETPGGISNIIQIRRAVPVTLTTPDGQEAILTSAQTVGQVLEEAGLQFYAADFISPPPDTPVSELLTITYRPSRELMVETNAGIQQIRSTAETVGEALAEAGIPLLGLDYSLPAESEALPDNGRIRVVRVHETVQFVQKSIPFETETESSPDVEFGQQQILQPGQPGLAVARTRIRYEDGQEVNRIVEEESIVQPPQNRIVNTGTKIVVKTTTVGNTTLEYWHATEMYATVYSPCNSGTGGCSYGTASGLRAGKGVVAVDRSLYNYLQGQRIYVPGYGYAVIGDIGGGYIIEDLLGVPRYQWIDLGFDDNNIVNMNGWLTVYFLAPAPASVPPFLQ